MTLIVIEAVLIFVGAGIGSVLRHVISGWVGFRAGPGFPWGTLTVNLLGCFVLGFFASSMPQDRTFLFVLSGGIVGGFTTFSTLMFETANLALSGQNRRFLLNAFGSLFLGFLAFFGGVGLGAFF